MPLEISLKTELHVDAESWWHRMCQISSLLWYAHIFVSTSRPGVFIPILHTGYSRTVYFEIGNCRSPNIVVSISPDPTSRA